MHYLLNTELSLRAKGMLSIMLHLQEGGMQIDIKTVAHYSKELNVVLTDVFRELQSHGYIVMQARDDNEKIKVTILENNNEIKE